MNLCFWSDFFNRYWNHRCHVGNIHSVRSSELFAQCTNFINLLKLYVKSILQKCNLTLLWQKFRESDVFTKEVAKELISRNMLLRFFVKSILANLKSLKLPFWHFSNAIFDALNSLELISRKIWVSEKY